MKTKSMHTDIKSLVLAKSHQYAKRAKIESSSDEEETSSVPLRKATEADKERKREKMRLKRQRKREAREKSVKKDVNDSKKLAINYLHSWNSARETWSFKKNLQCWLLKNVFSIDNIADKDFEILLNYLIDLKGAAKTRLSEECENIIKKHEEKLEESISNADLVIFERARKILQILV